MLATTEFGGMSCVQVREVAERPLAFPRRTRASPRYPSSSPDPEVLSSEDVVICLNSLPAYAVEAIERALSWDRNDCFPTTWDFVAVQKGHACTPEGAQGALMPLKNSLVAIRPVSPAVPFWVAEAVTHWPAMDWYGV